MLKVWPQFKRESKVRKFRDFGHQKRYKFRHPLSGNRILRNSRFPKASAPVSVGRWHRRTLAKRTPIIADPDITAVPRTQRVSPGSRVNNIDAAQKRRFMP